ncbi:uncharacterized protein LOC111591940 [Drosophila hydei]|uniref:Uncharacterized protein LOC111591940 n=1 Tax=Drosophila hydei TaxID=7224 RepID=A0A6J2STS9_DROHY|nr:uncharacterized protein LOC111591940 [Drosophila hydei]
MKQILIAFAVISAVAASSLTSISNDYLPPVQEAEPAISVPSNEYLAPVGQIDQGSLADDGYRYKTNRRVVVRRNRRDVSELSNEYLPPVQAVSQAPVQYAPAPVSNEYLPPVQSGPAYEAAPAHELADDGYRYKTNRRVVYRRRH